MKFTRLRARVGFEARRAVRATWGTCVVAVLVYGLGSGWFPDLRLPGSSAVPAVAAALLAGVLAAKVAARLRAGERRRTPLREMGSDIELGLLMLTATYVFLSVLGGVTSPIFPLVYVLVSFLVTFHRLAVGVPLAAAAVGFEAVMAFGPAAHPDAAAAFPGHVGFIAIFALLNVAFLHAEVARQRREHRKRVEQEVTSMREEAREFRLIATALGGDSRVRSREQEEEKLSQGSVETIHQQLLHTLDLLRRCLGLQTCALLWLDAAGEKLKVKELASDSPTFPLAEGPLPARTGVFGAILKDCRPLLLESPRPQMLPYLGGPAQVAAFAGVPVVEGRTTRGLLVADRKLASEGGATGGGRGGAMFSATEVDLLVSAAAQIIRIVQSERVFQAVERSKHEHERLYKASAALNRSLTLTEVYEAAIEGARGVCDFDFAAVATCDPRDGAHTIRRAVGDGAEDVDGKTYRDTGSLASMVVKNKLALPAGGHWRDRDDAYVFDASTRMRIFESMCVLPLPVKDEILGTFTLAARHRGAFPADRREMLGVIANQAAISLQNGRMVSALEEQATTDGLTGLVNHRTFQERFSAMLGRADRHKFSVSIILADIDHFKKINDAYGHPTGDQVLRRVAAILGGSARKIDIVARYGGEEFALVLEGTDRAGARQLAERIRLEVAQQSFESPKGPFGATLSLGLAVYPDDARSKQDAVARADQALYAAKHAGRDRTVCHGELRRERATA